MKKFMENLKNFLKNGRAALVILFVLELFLTMFITPIHYDDEWFLEQAANNTIPAYVSMRYTTWTSRLLLEIAELLMFRISKYAWVLVEALMVTLIGYSISRIFIKKEDKEQDNFMLICMILVYPFNIMNQSGWATTTIVYMWTLATGLFSLIPIKKIWDGEKIKIWEYLLYSLALVYACNQEQTCCVLFAFYIIFTVFMVIKNKKAHPYMVVQSILTIASLIFILTCPGNYIRKAQETAELFPDFEMLSILDKVALGFTSAMGYIIKDMDIVFIMLNSLIVVYIFSTYKEKLYRVIAVIPLLSIMLLGVTQNITNLVFPFFGSFRTLIISEQVMITPETSNNFLYLMPLLFAFTIFVCMMMSIILIFKNLKNNIAILIFLAGLASKLILGFSPTVFSSNERTMIYFDFAMIIISLMIWQELGKKTDKSDKKLQRRTTAVLECLGIIQYLNILICVISTQK